MKDYILNFDGYWRECNKNGLPTYPGIYLGSAELIHSHRLGGADVPPHCDNGDENSPYFGKDKTKFP